MTLALAIAWPAQCKTWLGGCADRDHAPNVVPTCSDGVAVSLGGRTDLTHLLLNYGQVVLGDT